MVSMCVGLLEEVPLPGSLQSLVLVVASLVCFQLPLQPPARSHCGRCCLRLFFVLNFHWTLDESCMPSRKRNDGEAHSHNNISVFEIAVKVGQSADFGRSEEHTSELQSHSDLVCRLLLEKKKRINRKKCL